jgi:hypothetical protein
MNLSLWSFLICLVLNVPSAKAGELKTVTKSISEEVHIRSVQPCNIAQTDSLKLAKSIKLESLVCEKITTYTVTEDQGFLGLGKTELKETMNVTEVDFQLVKRVQNFPILEAHTVEFEESFLKRSWEIQNKKAQESRRARDYSDLVHEYGKYSIPGIIEGISADRAYSTANEDFAHSQLILEESREAYNEAFDSYLSELRLAVQACREKEEKAISSQELTKNLDFCGSSEDL